MTEAQRPQESTHVRRRHARGRRAPVNLPDLRRRKRGVVPPLVPTIPDTYDAVAEGIVGPIKDQGACGSCWDFSGTCVVECACYKAGLLNPDGTDALSEQYTLDCYANGGCNGDDNTTVLMHAQTTGLARIADYLPYAALPGRCQGVDPAKLVKVQDWGFCDGGRGTGVTSREVIQQAILATGPVGCAVAAGDQWDGYSGGEYEGSANTEIDHDVVIVGWRPSQKQPGKVAWKVRNSWGQDWGEEGYMWITESADLVGTEAVFVLCAPGPTPPPPPPPPPPPIPPTPPPDWWELLLFLLASVGPVVLPILIAWLQQLLGQSQRLGRDARGLAPSPSAPLAPPATSPHVPGTGSPGGPSTAPVARSDIAAAAPAAGGGRETTAPLRPESGAPPRR